MERWKGAAPFLKELELERPYFKNGECEVDNFIKKLIVKFVLPNLSSKFWLNI